LDFKVCLSVEHMVIGGEFALGPNGRSIDAENAALAQEIARLQKENAQLLHSRLTRERALLVQENALLLQSTSFSPPGVHSLAPPGLGVAPTGLGSAPPGLSPPWVALQQTSGTNKWLAVDELHNTKRVSSSSLSVASTDEGSSVLSSVTSSLASSASDDCNDFEGRLESATPKTSLMLRNIPNCYSRTWLLELLDGHGFKGFYNLVYLPIDFSTRCGFGYAFVNFIDTESAETFMLRLQGFQRWAAPSDKVLDVTWSNAHQGFEAHVERYRNSPVMHETIPDELKPVVFISGERVPFPPPTKKPRAPRTRRRA